MAGFIPHDVLRAMAAGEIVIGTHTFRVALFTASATVGLDVVGLADLGANQVANGNGYTTAGPTRTVSVTDVDGSDWASVDSQDLSFTASGGSIGPFRYAVWYDDTHASDQILYYEDVGTNITITDGSTWTLTVAANGLFTMAQA